MSKIKDISDRLHQNPTEYTTIRFLIAKRTLGFCIMVYSLAFLFTIGGFSFGPFDIKSLSQLAFHTYSLLIISLSWFFYEFVVYFVHIYADDKRWLVAVGFIIVLLFAIIGLSVQFF